MLWGVKYAVTGTIAQASGCPDAGSNGSPATTVPERASIMGLIGHGFTAAFLVTSASGVVWLPPDVRGLWLAAARDWHVAQSAARIGGPPVRVAGLPVRIHV